MTQDLVQLFWIQPKEVASANTVSMNLLADAALQAGMALLPVTVEDIQVAVAMAGSQIHVRGKPVDRRSSLFHNKLYTWPTLEGAAWRSLALFDALERAGGCVAISRADNITSNDKLATIATVARAGIEVLPSFCVPTASLLSSGMMPADAGFDFPVVVKPAHWSGGRGVIRARDKAELLMALRLASASGITMVVQPMAGPRGDLTDVRVMCVDDEPLLAVREAVGADGTVHGATSGGLSCIAEVPAELCGPAQATAALFDSAWLGVDFLLADGRVFLSEVELDARLPASWADDARVQELTRQRFAAYRRRFELWRR